MRVTWEREVRVFKEDDGVSSCEEERGGLADSLLQHAGGPLGRQA